jgi:undecaprenyl-diphosphatase
MFNPHSGPEETTSSELAGEFPGARIHEINGKAVKTQVEEAIAESPSFLAVAGGDGTIRCAAGVVAGTDLPLLPVPAGTRNHFAREVGIETLHDAGRAASGTVKLVDVGEVNGEVFVNNAGIGVYPRIVKERSTHQKRFSKQTATLLATWGQMRNLHKFGVTVNGETFRAWMVFVGNGRYGTSIFDVATRESLSDGVLDVRILRADGKLARLRVMGALMAGRLEQSPMSEFDEVTSVELGFDRPRVDIALDGEVFAMDTPLRFTCRAKALRVLVPPPPEE